MATTCGRMMSLWSVGFMRLIPIVGPIVGWVAAHGSPMVPMAISALAALLVAGLS